MGALLTLTYGSSMISADNLPDFKQQAAQHCGSEQNFTILLFRDQYTIECENGVRVEFSLR